MVWRFFATKLETADNIIVSDRFKIKIDGKYVCDEDQGGKI
jgi:hypothetical protein